MVDQIPIGGIDLTVKMDEKQVRDALAAAGRDAGSEASRAIRGAGRMGAGGGGAGGGTRPPGAAGVPAGAPRVSGAAGGAAAAAGFALAAVAVAGVAVSKTFSRLNRIAQNSLDNLAQFSAEGAAGRARLTVGGIRRNIRAGRALGGDIGRFADARNRFLDAIEPITTALRGAALRTITRVIEAANKLADAFNQLIIRILEFSAFVADQLARTTAAIQLALQEILPFGLSSAVGSLGTQPLIRLLAEISADLARFKKEFETSVEEAKEDRTTATNEEALDAMLRVIGRPSTAIPQFRPDPARPSGRI